jgi:hypothetical protein
MTQKEWLVERLGWEDWGRLLRHAVHYAEEQIHKRWARRLNGVVLAGGHDANDVGSEAVARVLAGKCRLSPGWTRWRLEAELKRQVNGELRRLSSRREAGTTVSEWSVLRPDEDGGRQSVFDEVAGSLPNGYEEAARKSEEQERAEVSRELEGRLNGDAVAGGLLKCLREGAFKRREIAAKLGVDARAVTAARKRVEGKARGLQKTSKSERRNPKREG